MRKLSAVVFLFFLIPGVSLGSQVMLEDTFKDGVGARPLGMGGAFTAVADDINSIYYNPAGLGSLTFGYSFGEMDLYNYRYERNSSNSLNLGPVGYQGLRTKTISGEVLDVTTLAFGNNGPWGLSWGFSHKNIRAEADDVSYTSWSGDVGLLLKLTSDLYFGMVGQDVLKDPELDIPSTGRFGMAYRPFAEGITLAFDAETGRSGDVGVLTNYGAEFVMTDGFRLRAGARAGAGTAGATLGFPLFKIHYAFVGSKDQDEDSLHKVGLEISLPRDPLRPKALIRPREFVLVDVRGSLVGGRDEYSILGGAKSGADNIISQIRRARRDDAVDGIMLRISGFSGGLGSIGVVQDIRDELYRAKKSGKYVVAYVESSALGDEYYLASIADRIVAPKGSSIGGLGRSVAVTRVTELMDKIGVEWQIITEGKYKATFDVFSKDMTRDQRDMLASVVSDMHRQMITDISLDRKIEMAEVKEIGDGRIFTATKAKELNLVDEIGYFKDALSVAGELSSRREEVRIVRAEDLQSDYSEHLFFMPFLIAVIEVDGEIVTGSSGSNLLFGGTYVGSDTVTMQIKSAADNVMVGAIILRVNSPGGSPVASGQIYQELKRARDKGKVVIASMGDVAASGGYFVCAAADKIVANPSSITGSIGVIGAIPVLSELYKKVGVKNEVIKEGEHADMFSGLRKLSDEELKSIKDLSHETYIEFKRVVAEGRGMTTAEVEEVAQGRIYTGSQALEAGLVDRLGGFSEALELAKEIGKVPGEPRLIYYVSDPFWGGRMMEISERLGIRDGLFPVLWGTKLPEYRLSY